MTQSNEHNQALDKQAILGMWDQFIDGFGLFIGSADNFNMSIPYLQLFVYSTVMMCTKKVPITNY